MQLIGSIEIAKNTRKGKMILALPFWGNSDFFIAPSDKTGDNYPTFLIWNKKIKIGALWKSEYTKEGETKKYFSGNIFCPFLESKKMKIVVFEDREQKEDLYSGSVFWSFEDKKEVDNTQKEQETIFDANEEIF